MDKTYKVALVMSGGGIKGMAHLGVLQLMQELDIKVDVVAGTSAGALVGALYASGYTPKEIVGIAECIYAEFKSRPYKYTQFINKDGLIKSELIAGLLSKYIDEEKVYSGDSELVMFSTELTEGSLASFSTFSKVSNIGVARSAVASAAYPFVFSPIKEGSQVFSDGGMLAHFPADIIKNEADFVIGSYVSPISKVSNEELSSATSVAIRALSLTSLMSETQNFEHCDIMINPMELSNFHTFSISKDSAKKIFDIGYREALKHKEEFLKLKESHL